MFIKNKNLKKNDQTNMLYTLNLNNVICRFYLNKIHFLKYKKRTHLATELLSQIPVSSQDFGIYFQPLILWFRIQG